MCRKEADSFKASYWLMGLCGHLKTCVVDGKLSFRAWGCAGKRASLKYVSLREPGLQGKGTVLWGARGRISNRKVGKCLRVMGREQEVGPQASGVSIGGGGKG